VGVNGDIPTLCASRYLISVNAATLNDEHYSSGYSDSFIELAAPGVNVYTTMPVSFQAAKPYTTETGTSFASPMVAGISALIETLACPYYIALKDTQPEMAMELWRSWMRVSLVGSSSLKAKTAWGGRIDAKKLFQAVAQWCTENDTEYASQEWIPGELEWEIYPNPSFESFTIRADKPGILRLYDMLGTKMAEYTIGVGEENQVFEGPMGAYIAIYEDINGGVYKKVHFFSKG
jgi:subtilisin family serine protease